MAVAASASEMCERIGLLANEAKHNFQVRPTDRAFNPGLTGNAECRIALRLGGARAMNCQWAFSFRDPLAKRAFAALSDGTKMCPGISIILDQDQRVNHPDSYDLRKFDHSGTTIDVSLKDKGALQQTFVFLRFERTVPE